MANGQPDTYYDQWLQGPEAQQLEANYQQQNSDPTSQGYTYTSDGFINSSTGAVWGGAPDYTPPDPYTTGMTWDNPNLSFQGADELGLFGAGGNSAAFGDQIKNTYSQYGKSDSDIVHAAQQALQQHGQQFGQGYDAASSWGGINDAIMQNLGINLGNFDFKSLTGFSDQAAEDRGNAVKVGNASGGFFGQGNIFSDTGSYLESQLGDMSHAVNQNPERLALGINNPAESSLWSTILGKNYSPDMDMYGGATNAQQAGMQQKGLDPSVGNLVQMSGEAAAGGIAGSAGYGNVNAIATTGNKMQDGTNKDNFLQALPQLSQWLGNWMGGTGSMGNTTPTSNAPSNNVYAANNTGTVTDVMGDTNTGNTNMDDEEFSGPMTFDTPSSGGLGGGDVSQFNGNSVFGPSVQQGVPDLGGGSTGLLGGAGGLSQFQTPSAGGGGLLDFLTQGGGSDPSAGGGGTQGGGGNPLSGLGGSMGKALMNMAMNMYMMNQANSKASTAAGMSNPMNQPQRAPFQQQATDLAQNPQSYFQNNPFAQAATAATQNMIQATTGRNGNPFQTLGSALPQWMQALGGNYNDLLKIMQTGGGFDQGTGGAGQNYVPLAAKGLGYQSEALRGFGDVASNIFGDPSQPKTNPTNPMSGSNQAPL